MPEAYVHTYQADGHIIESVELVCSDDEAVLKTLLDGRASSVAGGSRIAACAGVSMPYDPKGQLRAQEG